MKTRIMRRVLYAGAATALLVACSGSGSEIESPGETTTGTSDETTDDTDTDTTDVSLIPASGCPTGTRSGTTTSGSSTVGICELTGEIQSNTEIPAGVTVVVSGPVTVGTDAGASTAGGVAPAATAILTIGAGATVVGNTGSDYILVNRGSQIIAQGTSSAPVVFTSLADVLATEAGSARSGSTDFSSEWGGVVINGRAPINACKSATATGGTADCVKDGEASTGEFGGGSATDNSGILNYVQVRYAGFRINGENELNGIAFQGVGSGTTVDYVQVHNNSDDGIEFFGGTVNAKHVVLTGNEDDSMDWTDGWTGKVQYVLVKHRGVGDNGFEMDNRGGSNDRLPRSNPTISNFTSIGQSTSSRGLLYREGTNGRLLNGIVTGFPTCLDIDQTSTYTNLSGDEFQSLYFSCTTPFDSDTGEASDEQTVFTAQSANNKTGVSTMAGVFPGVNELAVAFTDPGDSFFDTVAYIGAFGPSETTTSNWASGWTFGLFDTSALTCPSGTTSTGETLAGVKVCRMPSNVTSDMTLVAGLNYEMVGPVFIGADRGGDPASPLASGVAAILTVEAGTTLFGTSGSDYIVVTRGSQLRSNGTAARPVVYTSRSDLAGTVGVNTRNEWGGLVINGRAPINACSSSTATGGTAGCNKEGEGSSGLFGGSSSTDDSGNIYYSRVMYAGFRVNNENELNGIAFQGVGSETEVDYVQVHNNSDDGIEFFGGTVNAKHLVLTGNEDDSLDWTDGWTGKVQFVIVQHSNSGDNGFEMDNRGGSNDRLPRSNPTLSNLTLIGSSGSSGRGLLYREGTNGRILNGIVSGFPTCLDIDQASTYNNLSGDEFASLYFSCTTSFDADTGEVSDEQTVFTSQSANNKTGASTLSGFTFISGGTGVVPGANEQAVTALDPSTIDSFFTSTNYIGAVKDSSDTWYQGWTYKQP